MKIKRSRSESVVIPASDPSKRSIGHQPHRSGAGVHQDRRFRRQRTRSAANRAAFD